MDEELPDWNSWLRSGVDEAEERGDAVIPFAQLGLADPRSVTTFGAKVRENFWKTLGKHLQLPSATPPELSNSPSNATASPVATEVVKVVAQPAVAPAPEATGSMMDADWGLLETAAWQWNGDLGLCS